MGHPFGGPAIAWIANTFGGGSCKTTRDGGPFVGRDPGWGKANFLALTVGGGRIEASCFGRTLTLGGIIYFIHESKSGGGDTLYHALEVPHFGKDQPTLLRILAVEGSIVLPGRATLSPRLRASVRMGDA